MAMGNSTVKDWRTEQEETRPGIKKKKKICKISVFAPKYTYSLLQ